MYQWIHNLIQNYNIKKSLHELHDIILTFKYEPRDTTLVKITAQ